MNYLLVGTEEYLKYQFLEKFKKEELDFDIFYAGTSDIKFILDSFHTLPFASKHRIIVIKEIDKFSANEKESILKYLKSPSRSTTLVLESTSLEFNKFLEDCSKFTKLLRCDRLDNGKVTFWIKKEFTARKKIISPSAVNLIKEFCGNDLFLLKNEIEKIVSFVGDKIEITTHHIEAILGKASYKTVFELVNSVLERKIDKMLETLDRLATKERPHQILNLLAWQFRNFDKIRNIPRRFTTSDLEKSLKIILEADLSIKRGKMDARSALEQALVRLCLV